MAVIRQGGSNPNAGKVMTTRGPRDPDKRLCYGCGQLKADGLFTINGNGKVVCPECAGPKHARALDAVCHRADCEDGLCSSCVEREAEDADLDGESAPDA